MAQIVFNIPVTMSLAMKLPTNKRTQPNPYKMGNNRLTSLSFLTAVLYTWTAQPATMRTNPAMNTV